VTTRACFDSWIMLFDDAGDLHLVGEAGQVTDSSNRPEYFKRGELPYCIRMALKNPELVAITDSEPQCEGCLLAKIRVGRVRWVKRLEHNKKLYGAITASVSPDISKDEEERQLFIELANDLSLALTNIRLEKEVRRHTEHLEELVEERTRELKESEAKYREAERLSAIGKTAMMIGHDLRNPLQVVVNALYLIRETLESPRARYPDSEEMRGSTALLDRVDRQVEYMNKIVSDLQDYARPLRPELAETGLGQLITETLSTIRLPENIGVTKDIAKDTRVTVDPAMMKRVFTNLIINAIQAMPNGGQLTIRASIVEETILVSIKDTGAGIAKENISKLFTPLFTTKAKGQGFGLSVCKRIVEAHKGEIIVESEEGKGATFTVKLAS
jgi:signal transduction histidine kinase